MPGYHSNASGVHTVKLFEARPANGPLTIEAWSDSSYGDDADTGRTIIGSVLKVNGATVTASSRISKRVDSCVNHSELGAFVDATDGLPLDAGTDGATCALVLAFRNIVWVRGIKAALERRNVSEMPPTPVFVDNSGVLSMLDDITIKSPNKDIFRTLAEARERVHLDRAVRPVKISTKDNIANAMTKQEPGLRKSAAQLRLITGPMTVLAD